MFLWVDNEEVRLGWAKYDECVYASDEFNG